MSSYDTWLNVLTGISQGSFDTLYVKNASGDMVNVLTLIGASAGAVSSATAPLNISSGILSIDLSNYTNTAGLTTLLGGKISTTHEANKIGAADVTHLFDFKTQTLTLRNSSGVTLQLNVDNGGNLSLGADGVITVPILNAWDYINVRIKDSGGTVRLLNSSLTGALLWNGSQLATITDLSNYSTTAQMNTALATKQNTMSVGAGAFLSGTTVSGYDLRWLTNSVPTIGGGIRCLHFKSGFSIAQTVNLSSGQNDLDITATGVTDAEMKAHIGSSVSTTANSGLTSVGSAANGTVVFGVDSGIVALRSWVTGEISSAAHSISDVTGLQTALDAKQATLSAGAGCFLSGSTISSYTLRWNGSSVPSNPNVIQELHWSNYTVAQTVNIGTGKVELTIGHPTGMATQTYVNSQIAAATHTISDVTGLQTALDSKALDSDVTTAFAGINVELSQKVETSQVLTNVPANAVFTDTLYTHPSQHSISMITGLQTELNKISRLETGVSGISLGGGTGAAHRFAVHEVEIGDPNHTAGHYMYGMGLYVGSTVGTAFWGGTLAALPDQGSGTGTAPHLFIKNNGLVGVNTTAPAYTLDITGDIRATGTVYGATKSFDIEHEGKEGYRLRHWCMEGDAPGGSLIYKRQITTVKAGVADLIMPSWFGWLAKNVMVFATGYKHFGLAWGEQDSIDSCVIHITVSKGGIYNIMVTADRNDMCATSMCRQEVEYIPEEPEDSPPPFPPV